MSWLSVFPPKQPNLTCSGHKVQGWVCSFQQLKTVILFSQGYSISYTLLKCKYRIFALITAGVPFLPAHRPTKAPLHLSMSKTFSPTVTTVSGCVLSGSARTPRSSVVPTAPRWPCPPSGTTRRPVAVRPARGPRPAQIPIVPDGAWRTSSALSSSSWFSLSSPSSSLLSSSTLLLNEQFAPPNCRVKALFFSPPSVVLCSSVYTCCFLLLTE